MNAGGLAAGAAAPAPVRAGAAVPAAWNATAVAYPQEHLLHRLIEAQVARTPDAEAVRCAGAALTYRELNLRANRLARALRARDVGPEVLVAVCAERSLELVVALVAVLKAGGAYVPIDPAYPAARQAFMLADAQAPVLLTQAHLAGGLPAHQAEVLRLDADAAAWAGESGDDLEGGAAPDGMAYVIYTSGSTGQPKGAINTHRGICNRLLWMQQAYALGARDRVLQKTTFSFDVSVWEFFWPLLAGAPLEVAPPGLHYDSAALADFIAGRGITVLHFVPALLQLFLAEPAAARCTALRAVIASGEALSFDLQERFFARLPRCALHNLYGPTEAAVDVTAWACRPGDGRAGVPIGRPIANLRIHILDAAGAEVAVGAAGELHIGGTGVGRGYLRRPELTAERFLPDPFASAPAARLYRTGDLARWREDGAIEYLGRLDHQVKIRGLRIELGEIESALRACAGVREAVVGVRPAATGDQRLVAWVVADGAPDAVPAAALRAALLARLPDYMVPSAFIALAQLPLTPNGKVDRAALPAPERAPAAPASPLEAELAATWGGLLGGGAPGAHDNLFALGADSLLATRFLHELRRRRGIALGLSDVLEEPTVAGLARRAAAASAAAMAVEPQPADDATPAPLSPEQERLWFLDQLEPGSSAHLLALTAWLDGALDLAALGRAITALGRRHAALRTRFPVAGGQPRQERGARPTVALKVVELAAVPEAERAAQARALACAEARTGFDLADAPPWRAVVFRLAPARHLLALTLHGLIADAQSCPTLLADLAAEYLAPVGGAAAPPGPGEAPYAAYARWQRTWREGDECRRQLAWQAARLAGLEPLTFTGDRPRPRLPSTRGGRAEAPLPAALVAALRGVARAERTTLFTMLLAAFATLLHRCTGSSDLPIAIPVAKRARAEFARTVGLFTNTLLLRVPCAADQAFAALVADVHAVAAAAYANQEAPFDRVVQGLRAQRDPANPGFANVMFDCQDESALVLPIPGVRAEFFAPAQDTAIVDVLLTAHLGQAGSTCSVRYAADLYDRPTMERLLGHFLTLLGGIAAGPQRRLDALPLLGADELALVTRTWNDTAAPFPREACLHGLFADQAARTPERTALICGDRQLTYRELERAANRLANRLVAAGAGPERLVGVLLDRSVELVVAVLATLKAGAGYVPLDRKAGAERLAFIAGDARLVAVVAQDDHAARLPAGTTVLHPLRDAGADDAAPRSGVHAGNVAYVIYTSGSSGDPKGVVVEHRSAVNAVLATIARYRDLAVDRTLFQSSVTFDSSVSKILQSLLGGGQLVVAPEDADFATVLELTARHGVPRLTTTPSELAILNDMPERLPACIQVIGAAGENLAPGDVDRILPRVPILNIYGPTEATISTTSYRLVPGAFTAAGTVPIGRPIMNYQVYVLDGALNPLPIGCIGEICIGGVGVARGYLNAPELTAARFIADPFAAGGRMYRSGDLGRWLPSGDLEFRGRIDHQVKIRGYRIELGEVEAALSGHAAVRQAVVVARTSPTLGAHLAAYATLNAGAHATAAELTAFLAGRLPDHMVPAHLVVLEAFPLLPSGKVDRRRLPVPAADGARRRTASAARPTLPLHHQLLAIWTDLLAIPDIAIDDDFFALGGHSLIGMRMILRIQDATGRRLPMTALFTHPTVAGLATLIADAPGAQPDAAQASLLQPLQTAGARLPLFFISGFLDISRHLGPDQPFYGLDCPVTMKSDDPAMTFAAIARRCVRDLRTVQPHGPYRIGGHCFGAIVAFAIANQLQAAGEEVTFLALMDPPNPPNCVSRASFSARLIFNLRASLRLGPVRALPFLFARARGLGRAVASQWAGEGAIDLYADFAPAVFDGRLTVVLAKDSFLRMRPEQDPRLLWRSWATGGISIIEAAGDHVRFCREPYVRALGATLRAAIERSEAAEGSSGDRPRVGA